MKKYILKISLIICALILIFNFNTVQASGMSDIIDGIEDFENAYLNVEVNGVSVGIGIDQGELSNISDIVFNILLTIGIVVAVIVGLIIGMKFMTGSVEQKAEVKETLIGYVVGCIVIFGAFGIWKLVLTILNQI